MRIDYFFGVFLLCVMGISWADAERSGIGSDELNGSWLVILTADDIGQVQAPMRFEARFDGSFEAYSTPGATRRTLGFWRGGLAGAFGGESFSRGAMLHIFEGTIEPAETGLALRGDFLSSVSGRLRFEGQLTEGHIRGELRNEQGVLWGVFDAAPASSEDAPLRDYAELPGEIRRILSENLFNPNLIDTPAWNSFFDTLERRMPNVRDDVEALTVFYIAVQELGLSHLALVGSGFGEDRPADSSAEGAQVVTIDYPRDGVAHMRIRHFAGDPERIREAFMQIDFDGARTLILDLRSNRGGNLSAITVAEHLFDVPLDGGLFTGAIWWKMNQRPPSLQADRALPVLSEYDLDAFFSILAEHGALVLRASPTVPYFAGPVYLLVDRRTASASEPLADMLQTTRRATLIGEPTAGSMLSSQTFELSTGLVLIAPTADYHSADGRRLEGVGVEPDILIASADALEETLRLIDLER